MTDERLGGDRRREERRVEDVRLADFTLPEMRKAIITTTILLVIVVLFLYMVADVLVATIAGVVVGAFLIPFNTWLEGRLGNKSLSAIVTITLVTLPLVAVLGYTWVEVADATEYLEANSRIIAARLTETLQRVPFIRRVAVEDDLSRWVAAASTRSGRFIGELQQAVGIIAISTATFLVTVFYVLTDHERVLEYLRRKIPGRYRDLEDTISKNIRAVVYGALYATFLTQVLKSAIVLGMNLAFDVPLAFVLAILSFFIGFLPIVGSWAVYVPVGLYLMVFRQEVGAGIIVIAVGLIVNTLFMSLYLRPKIAAEKSHVLNFYWMFIALVTGVYTFGLVGIIIGPVLIGVLKAVFETITGEPVPVFRDGGGTDLRDLV